jgi:hypothetical protein
MTKNTAGQNPFHFNNELMDAIADTSAKMYDIFYDLLASYQFDFPLAEKNWMVDQIANDIKMANHQATMEATPTLADELDPNAPDYDLYNDGE